MPPHLISRSRGGAPRPSFLLLHPDLLVDELQGVDLLVVEAGRLDVKPKTFEVGELFGALRGVLKPLLAENSLNLAFESAERESDPEKLRALMTFVIGGGGPTGAELAGQRVRLLIGVLWVRVLSR